MEAVIKTLQFMFYVIAIVYLADKIMCEIRVKRKRKRMETMFADMLKHELEDIENKEEEE